MNELTSAQLGGLTRRARAVLNNRGLKRLPPAMHEEFIGMGAKFCSKCERVKALDKFGVNRSLKHGFQTRCKKCHLKYHEENREREIARMRAYKEVNNINIRLANGYQRAVAAGLPAQRFGEQELFEYWAQNSIAPDRSIFSGAELTRENFSLDHLVPLSLPNSPGHVLSNIVPCTLVENAIKQSKHFVYLLGKIHAA